MEAGLPQGVYLGCNPNPAADQYIVEVNGTEYGPFAPLKIKAAVTIIMEIESLLVAGTLYEVRAKAVNVFGDESEWTDPFEFFYSGGGIIVTRTAPDPPSIIRFWIKE